MPPGVPVACVGIDRGENAAYLAIRILNLLKNVEDRSAVFRSVYAYAEPKFEPMLFNGECTGIISSESRGTGGFGYDPIFIPTDESKTFAEMKIGEKNRISHRGKALDKLVEFLQKSK